MTKELKTYATHFCGVGGACCGLEQAGLECRFAIDYLEMAVVYRQRNLGHQAELMDITTYVPQDRHAADLLWTSPPCQTFSSCSRETATLEDKRNNLFLCSLDYVAHFRPRFVVFENVMGILTHNADKAGGGTVTSIRNAFKQLGYHVELNVINARYWLPQDRERVFIVASRDGEKGLIPQEPILNKFTFGQIQQKGYLKTAYSEQIYKTVLASVARNSAENRSPYRFTLVGQDDVLPTLTCGFGGGATRKKTAAIDETGGVKYLRHITAREGARAQGFPESWAMPESESDAWILVGNAVPVPVARAIAEHLKLVAIGEQPKSKNEIWASVPRYIKEASEDTPPFFGFD